MFLHMEKKTKKHKNVFWELIGIKHNALLDLTMFFTVKTGNTVNYFLVNLSFSAFLQ